MASLQAYMVIHELLEAFKELQSDPKTFETNIAKAYAISDAQQAKLAEARQTLADSVAAVALQKDVQKAHDARARELDQREADLKRTGETHAMNETRLNDFKKALDDRAAEQSAKASAHAAGVKNAAEKEKSLAHLDRKLGERADALDAREKNLASENERVARYEQSLKERAAKLREHTEGL